MEGHDFRDQVEAVREQTDIVEVVSQYVTLDRSHNGNCPFEGHDDKNPSFSVNAEKQIFKCFGCGKGGDVFKFLMERKAWSFWDALSHLAAKVGVALPTLSPEAKQQIRKDRVQDEILEAATAYYEDQLKKNAAAIDYLRGRGFTAEIISQFRVGYTDGQLRKHLQERGFKLDDIEGTGLVEKGKDFLYQRLTFPYTQRGRVITIRGRRFPDCPDKPGKYMSLRNHPSQLFNIDALRKPYGHILMCEGETDTLSAAQLGYTTVGIPGANCFNKDWIDLFPDDFPLISCLDQDKAGQRGTEILVEAFGPLIRVLQLPPGEDLNDYVRANSEEDMRSLVESAPCWLDMQFNQIEQLDKPQRKLHLKKLIPWLAKLELLDTPEYLWRFAKLSGLRKADVRDMVAKSQIESSASKDRTPAIQPLPKSKVTEAEALLSDPLLIKRLLDDTERIGLVGEDENKIMVYLALTTRISEKIINLLIEGESSGGKSHLIGYMIKFIPPEDVVEVSAMSAKALFHLTKSLAHKFLYIAERDGTDEADYSVRTLQSEGKLIFMVTIKNPETGNFETVEKNIDGPAGIIETTTRLNLNAENQNRCLELFIDETEVQTRRVHGQTNREFLGHVVNEKAVCGPWINAQRLLKPYPVYIPFVRRLKFPDGAVRHRRDYRRFLNLIAASCLLHQRQRATVTKQGKEHLVAGIRDYQIAYELGSKVLLQMLKDLSPAAEDWRERIRNFLIKRDGDIEGAGSFTKREIINATRKPEATIRRYLNKLLLSGDLEKTDTGRGKTHKYIFHPKPTIPSDLLTTPDDLVRAIEKDGTDDEKLAVRPTSSHLATGGDNVVNSHTNNEIDEPRQGVTQVQETYKKSQEPEGKICPLIPVTP